MRIELIYYYAEKYKTYEGRLLGLVDEKQFAYLYNNISSVASKVRTGRSMTLSHIQKAGFKNQRLVLSVLGSRNEQELFITRPLAEIYHCYLEDDKVDGLSFLDNDGNWLTVEKI